MKFQTPSRPPQNSSKLVTPPKSNVSAHYLPLCTRYNSWNPTSHSTPRLRHVSTPRLNRAPHNHHSCTTIINHHTIHIYDKVMNSRWPIWLMHSPIQYKLFKYKCLFITRLWSPLFGIPSSDMQNSREWPKQPWSSVPATRFWFAFWFVARAGLSSKAMYNPVH